MNQFFPHLARPSLIRLSVSMLGMWRWHEDHGVDVTGSLHISTDWRFQIKDAMSVFGWGIIIGVLYGSLISTSCEMKLEKYLYCTVYHKYCFLFKRRLVPVSWGMRPVGKGGKGCIVRALWSLMITQLFKPSEKNRKYQCLRHPLLHIVLSLLCFPLLIPGWIWDPIDIFGHPI